MKRLGYLAILVVVGAMAVTLPAWAESTQVFKAQFHDSPSSACPPGADICGKGVVKGFGTATTSLTFTSFVPGPGANCVTATATRTATLDSDGSVLQLALVGTICDQKVSALTSLPWIRPARTMCLDPSDGTISPCARRARIV